MVSLPWRSRALAPTLAPALAPQPVAGASSSAAIMPHPALTNVAEISRAPEPEDDDTPDVEVVPAPPKPPIELVDITDEQSDDPDGSQSARGEDDGNLNVQPAGNITLEPRPRASAPPRPPPHSSLLRSLRDNVDHPVRRPLNANLMVAHELCS